jgi:hypothetical protein
MRARRHPMTLRHLAVLAAAASIVGCRTGGGPRPTTPGAPAVPDFVASYVGQKRILRSPGSQTRLSLSRGELGRLDGVCDLAVEIRQARLDSGVLRLDLEPLGRASLEGKRQRGRPDRKTARCQKVAGTVVVSVSGFSGEDGAEAVEADLGKLLRTPEGYLVAHGVPFDRPAAPQVKPIASTEPAAPVEEKTLGAHVTAWPRRLLVVDADVHDPARKKVFEVEVDVVAVVGADGRVYEPKVRASLDKGHEDHVLRVLPLWRFDPARRKDQPVSARVPMRVVLRID